MAFPKGPAPHINPLAPLAVYGGKPLSFEGGREAILPSPGETMPAEYQFAPKVGFDERNRVSPPDSTATIEGDTSHSYDCPHGCGVTSRSSHGLARHVHARHGGFKGLGHALVSSKGGETKSSTERKR